VCAVVSDGERVTGEKSNWELGKRVGHMIGGAMNRLFLLGEEEDSVCLFVTRLIPCSTLLLHPYTGTQPSNARTG
jgi:hypothetical protein